MQLMTPTPIKALRQARNASPSSERRTPGAAAIYPDLFTWDSRTPAHHGSTTYYYRILVAGVERSHINLNASRSTTFSSAGRAQSPRFVGSRQRRRKFKAGRQGSAGPASN